MDAKRDLVFGTVLFEVRELLKKRFWNHFEVPSVCNVWRLVWYGLWCFKSVLLFLLLFSLCSTSKVGISLTTSFNNRFW